MPTRHSQSTSSLLAQKNKAVENWDDDFDELGDDFNPRESLFQSSVSSAGSRQFAPLDEEDEENEFEDNNTAFQQRRLQGGANFLTSFSEKQDFDDDFASGDLTTRFSSMDIKNLSPNKKPVSLGKTFDNMDVYQGDFDDDDDDDEYQTIRQRPKRLPKNRTDAAAGTGAPVPNTLRAKKSSKSFSSSLIQGDFFNPPPPSPTRSKSKSPKKSSSRQLVREAENFEEGFDVETSPDDLGSRLQQVKTQMHYDNDEEFDSWGEESLGFRANSRLSEASTASSSVFSSSYEESEHEGEDFFDGVEIPEKHVNFQEILEIKQRDAQQIAEHEEELLFQGKKYDTIRSNGSGGSIKNLETIQDEDEIDLDFFDGIEVGEDAFEKPSDQFNTHKNVVVKGKEKSQAKRPSTNQRDRLKLKQSMPQLREKSPTKRGSTSGIGTNISTSGKQRATTGSGDLNTAAGERSLGEISPKKRVASSHLRPVQSMSNFGTRKSSARPKYSRGRTGGKVFGDGTELDSFNELEANVESEQTFTVTPKSYKSGTIKRKPLDSYREKAERKPKREKQSSSTTNNTNASSSSAAAGVSSTSPQKASALKNKKSMNLTKKRRKDATKRVPGLIQQLGPPTASIVSRGHNGDMRFNPRKLVWEGNDIELKKFDSVHTKAPGLIAFISNKGVQVVGDMVFDPEKMCWIRVGQNDQEEPDPFEGLDDLDVSVQSRASHRPGSVPSSVKPSFSSSVQGEFEVGDEFDLSADLVKRLQHEDERWHRKCAHWFSPDEEFDREYLNEIRQMVMK